MDSAGITEASVEAAGSAPNHIDEGDIFEVEREHLKNRSLMSE